MAGDNTSAVRLKQRFAKAKNATISSWSFSPIWWRCTAKASSS